MKRRELRENIFKIVFSLKDDSDFSSFFGETFEFYKEDNKISEKDGEYIKNEVLGIGSKLAEIDEAISENLKNYTFDRISRVCLAVLRVGIYEIMYTDDIPDSVAVSEAIYLADSYEDEKAKLFVNGVLGTIARKKTERND